MARLARHFVGLPAAGSVQPAVRRLTRRLATALAAVAMVGAAFSCAQPPRYADGTDAVAGEPNWLGPTAPVAAETPVDNGVQKYEPPFKNPIGDEMPSRVMLPTAWQPRVTPRHWRWIVVHHSATPTGGADAFDVMHRGKGWDELGYHFVIGNGTDTPDGVVEVGSRWPKQKHGAHAKTPDNRFNDYGIGICLVGNFDNGSPSPRQLRSLAVLTAFLMREYQIPAENILGHSDTGKATECPGRYVSIAQVRRLAGEAVAKLDAAQPARRAPHALGSSDRSTFVSASGTER